MKIRLIIALLFVTAVSFGQQISDQIVVSYRDVYLDNNLVYLMSNDSLYNGSIQHRRKNGHLVQEELIDNGVVICWISFYNRMEEVPAEKLEYNKEKPNVTVKLSRYNLDKSVREIVWYDELGNKKLVEEFEDEKLMYSCGYLGKKKQGKEFCYDNDGSPITILYKNGKKIKD